MRKGDGLIVAKALAGDGIANDVLIAVLHRHRLPHMLLQGAYAGIVVQALGAVLSPAPLGNERPAPAVHKIQVRAPLTQQALAHLHGTTLRQAIQTLCVGGCRAQAQPENQQSQRRHHH